MFPNIIFSLIVSFVDCLNNTSSNITCIYNNQTFTENQYTWIVDQDAQCYCKNGTWVDCD
jgi:hypothetical protein